MKAFYLFPLLALLLACSKDNGKKPDDTGKTPASSLKDKIAKTWVARAVTEDGTVVYTKGESSNIKPGYTSFKLQLQSNGSVALNEMEGSKITGIWQLGSSDTKLILQNLTPAPSESGGTLEYAISAADENKLNITASKVNHKTGGTLNKYELIPE